MKKLVLATVITSLLSGTALAGNTTMNSEYGSDKEMKFGIKHEIGSGFGAGLEVVTADNLKYQKETNLSVDYNFFINSAWYIQPQFELSIPSSHYSKKDGQFVVDNKRISAKFRASNTVKFGLETGFNMDNGLYTSARYRFEVQDGTLNFNRGLNNSYKVKNENKLHRVDLTLGYLMGNVMDLSANYIFKHDINKMNQTYNGVKSENKDLKSNQHELELKAGYLGLGDFQPYVMYTVKSDTDYKDINNKVKNDNIFAVGVNYSF